MYLSLWLPRVSSIARNSLVDTGRVPPAFTHRSVSTELLFSLLWQQLLRHPQTARLHRQKQRQRPALQGTEYSVQRQVFNYKRASERISESVSEWVSEWRGWVGGWARGWVNEWVSERVGDCMSRVNEWASEWVSVSESEWMNGASEWVSEWAKQIQDTRVAWYW